MENGVKKPWLSKTLWTNLVVIVGTMFVPAVADFVSANPEIMVSIWGGVNILLRWVSKDKLSIGE